MVSPYATAALMVIAVKDYADAKGKSVPRARMSRSTVMYLSDRRILRVSFLAELADELAGLGWHLLELRDGSFGLIRTDATDSWTKISAKRVEDLVLGLISGDVTEHDLFERLDRPDEDEPEDE
ncbi:hypothetical protein Rumeso_03668 [Rubellimicrobium mesophilum DSM 19309]|uniref:Uncharacterized protein n=2 Tax=Rubellimicrobium TaxID=295418 RepID=A0A017HK61_9RHOB|nr:hypothetical protein Rumeso_03668 [Rubellimicrobium mesophilum DSM 19309]